MSAIEITLDGKYKLGYGFGSWAKSWERKVKPGDVRVIGGTNHVCLYSLWPLAF